MGIGGSPKGILVYSGNSPDVPWPSTMGLVAWLATGGGAQESRAGDPARPESRHRERQNGMSHWEFCFPNRS